MTGLYLLDTCAWLDAFNAPEKLRPEVRALIDRQPAFSIAAISLLEVARKAEVGNLLLQGTIDAWFELALPVAISQVLPITPKMAIESS